jgi:membrane-associated phospholipid phosphatase
MKEILLKNSRILYSYFIFLGIGITLGLVFGKADIHIFINRNATVFSDFIFKYLTHLGDGLFAVIVILVLLFFSFRNSFSQLIAFLSSGLLAQLLKRFAFKGMPRPRAFFEGIYDLHLVEGVKVAKLNTFPSGHTATAFALFFCLIFTTKNSYLRSIYFILALLVGYSRMHLSQHFLPDVLAGSFIGVITAILSIYLMNRWNTSWLDRSLQKQLSSKK